jgi:hypothetical protein
LERNPAQEGVFVSANNIGFAIFVIVISLAAIVRLYRIRRIKMNLAMEVATYGSQIMCPACGSITARAKAYCLHCGKQLPDPRVCRIRPALIKRD